MTQNFLGSHKSEITLKINSQVTTRTKNSINLATKNYILKNVWLSQRIKNDFASKLLDHEY